MGNNIKRQASTGPRFDSIGTCLLFRLLSSLIAQVIALFVSFVAKNVCSLIFVPGGTSSSLSYIPLVLAAPVMSAARSKSLPDAEMLVPVPATLLLLTNHAIPQDDHGSHSSKQKDTRSEKNLPLIL